jgi:hypothetical protein
MLRWARTAARGNWRLSKLTIGNMIDHEDKPGRIARVRLSGCKLTNYKCHVDLQAGVAWPEDC